MTEPNLDEQIQLILRDFDNAVSIYTIEVKARYETAKAQIQEIIANQVREARLEEAKLFNRYFDDNQAFKGFAEERLKELGE